MERMLHRTEQRTLVFLKIRDTQQRDQRTANPEEIFVNFRGEKNPATTFGIGLDQHCIPPTSLNNYYF
jgi:hypothetical protein